jgi:uncharacterized SAM-binding protein YcdF (DUF218 family)
VVLDQVKAQLLAGDRSSRRKTQPLRNILAAGALLLLLILLAYAFHPAILTGIADALIIQDELQPADAIVLLNGDYDTRPFRAGELYKQGLAPVILVARAENDPVVDLGLTPNETDVSVGVMEKLGVPREKIIVLPFPGGTTSTYDEAAVIKQYIRATRIQKIILVTSAFHTRRARWIFEKVFAGLPVSLEMAATPEIGFDQTNWWQNEGGLITVNNETIKLIYYFFKYR